MYKPDCSYLKFRQYLFNNKEFNLCFFILDK